MVPSRGRPKAAPLATLEVEATPAMKKARAPRIAASIPCARRAPKSLIGRPCAAATMRAAFEAKIVCDPMRLRIRV